MIPQMMATAATAMNNSSPLSQFGSLLGGMAKSIPSLIGIGAKPSLPFLDTGEGYPSGGGGVMDKLFKLVKDSGGIRAGYTNGRGQGFTVGNMNGGGGNKDIEAAVLALLKQQGQSQQPSSGTTQNSQPSTPVSNSAKLMPYTPEMPALSASPLATASGMAQGKPFYQSFGDPFTPAFQGIGGLMGGGMYGG